MSIPSWQADLLRTLESLPTPDRAPRVAVLGVGNEFNGDDAVGPLVARFLQQRIGHHDHLLVIDAGLAPENQTGALRPFAPDLVLLIDAAQMDAEPGEVRWIPWQDTVGVSASTHTLPLHMLARFLTLDMGCEVGLLGIQPSANEVDMPLSEPVSAALPALVERVVNVLLGK